MAMLLVLLFPALGFTGAALIVRELHRHERVHHARHHAARAQDLVSDQELVRELVNA